MINPVRFYSKNHSTDQNARSTTVTKGTNGANKKQTSANSTPRPLPDLRNLPKPPQPKKLRLVLENTEDGTSSTFVFENRAYPGEAARKAVLAERERTLFINETEFEDLRRRALQSEQISTERERNLRELEALLRARELLLEEKEKQILQKPASMSKESDPAIEQLKIALDQREETLKQTQAALDTREEEIRKREQHLIDADALMRMQVELERREKELTQGYESLHEREQFLEESENLLCEKGQALVERQTLLDQREDELGLITIKAQASA